MIHFNYHEVKHTTEEDELYELLVHLVKSEGYLLSEVNVVFCSDDFLLGLNRTHLDHDYYTDILTFDFSEGKSINGELYISLDRVIENSQGLKLPVNQELARVVIHGFLHLCGYLDGTERQKTLMTEREDHYLSVLRRL